jgi:tRNA U38,U39,U40 pseudouridine synthase TruA
MKKIFQAITGGLLKDIGKVIDNLHTSEEERLEAKQKLQELLEQADKEAQDQVTERWKYDMQSDSFLSKNIRPMVLVFLTVMFTLFAFTDGNIGEFKVQKEYIPIFQTLLITVYGAYFVGRSWEKGKKNGEKDN